MSDPMVNIEIEDVLASIRRLVSEGEAPKKSMAAERPAASRPEPATIPAAASDLAETPANISAAPEKLVLSPEQLIEIPTAAAREPLVLGDPIAVDAAHETEVAAAKPSEPVAPIPMAGWQGFSALPPEVSSDDTVQPPAGDRVELGESQQQSEPREQGPTLELVNNDARAQLLSTIEELEAAVTETNDDFEPDGSEASPIVDWEKTTENGAIFGARAATTRVADMPETVAEDPVEDDVLPADTRTATLAEVRRLAQDEIGRATSTLDDELDDFIAADKTADHEDLRAMVVEIVREELQGALGERITRNVRKLVRREIYRVLASEDFS